MPRVARIVLPGMPHHITQWGNNRQEVFFVDDDRLAYLRLLKENCEGYGLSILGYCLMSNHVHLVATPAGEDSLAKALGRTHFAYAQYVNRVHGRSGHLWHNRFYSCALDEAHFYRALSYVERNPVRARIVRLPWRYRWSSASAHVGREDPAARAANAAGAARDLAGLLDLAEWRKHWSPKRWETQLRHSNDDDIVARLRLNTHRGRPLATDAFLSKLERRLGRRLRPLPVGRPKKATAGKSGSRKPRKKVQ